MRKEQANVTCGFSQLSRQDVLEEGEHKRAVQIPHMFTLFEDARLQAGTGRRNGLSLLSLKPQQARSASKREMWKFVIWSFGHFDVFQREQKGKGGTKGKTKVIKEVNIKKLKL